ncbi:MAG: hypothetical protein EP310_03390 [Bacteroidetes bacterium]|nr:MAG: hypothetical protein EP310_03390 [Bacteroidota bacterium]
MIGIVNLYKILIFVLTMFTSLSMNGQVDPDVDFDLSGCHDAAIAVYAYGGNGETAPAGAHNNIQITGNSISGSSNPAIVVTSTSKLILKSNTIESPNNELLVPWVMNFIF